MVPALTEPLASPAKATRITRRQMLMGCFAGAGLTVGGGAYARWVEPFAPRWERHTLELAGLPAAFDGVRVVQISDMHLRPTPAEYLEAHLAEVMQRRADLIVLTGDYISFGDARWLDPLARMVATLSAPLGVFAIMGNHEYCVSRWLPGGRPGGVAWFADETTRCLTRAGAVVLRNASAMVRRGDDALQIVGLDDLWCHRCDPAAAFADIDPARPCLTLVHNPDAIDLLRDRPTQAILAGHTHGGQVCLPLIGPPLLPVRNRQYAAGLFRVGRQLLYVSRGLGFIRQVRFNCPPELTEFTLARRPA